MSSEEALSRSTKAAVTKLFLLPIDMSVLRWAWGISPRSTSPSGSERTIASVRRWLASRARIVPRGTERTPSQPAPDTGADAAFPDQHHVPRPALAPCRMGHLTTTRSMDGQAGGLHLATFFSWSLHSASARLQPPPSAL